MLNGVKVGSWTAEWITHWTKNYRFLIGAGFESHQGSNFCFIINIYSFIKILYQLLFRIIIVNKGTKAFVGTAMTGRDILSGLTVFHKSLKAYKLMMLF